MKNEYSGTDLVSRGVGIRQERATTRAVSGSAACAPIFVEQTTAYLDGARFGAVILLDEVRCGYWGHQALAFLNHDPLIRVEGSQSIHSAGRPPDGDGIDLGRSPQPEVQPRVACGF